MFRNRPLGAKKMLSGAFKAKKHIKTIPKPKGLHSNIVKIILGNFLEKSFFGVGGVRIVGLLECVGSLKIDCNHFSGGLNNFLACYKHLYEFRDVWKCSKMCFAIKT